jgi:hypothetical protein
MAVTTRNIDGTTPWANTNNPHSARFTYAAGAETQEGVLEAVGTWLTTNGNWTAVGDSANYKLVAPAASFNRLNDTIVKVADTLTAATTGIPATGTITVAGDTYTYTGISGQTLTGISPALTKTYATDDAMVIVGHTPKVRTFKSLCNDVTTYKYLYIDVVTAGLFKADPCQTIVGITVTNKVSPPGGATNQQLTMASAGELYVAANGYDSGTPGKGGYAIFFSVIGTTRGSITNGNLAGCSSGVIDFIVSNPDFSPTVSTPFISLNFYPSNGGFTCQPKDLYGSISFVCNQIVTAYGVSSPNTESQTFLLDYFDNAHDFSGKIKASSMQLYNRVSNGTSQTKCAYVGMIKNCQIVGGGTWLDEAILKIDSDGLISETGADTAHLLFPMASTYTCNWAVPK